jgi:hypothetical protein
LGGGDLSHLAYSSIVIKYASHHRLPASLRNRLAKAKPTAHKRVIVIVTVGKTPSLPIDDGISIEQILPAETCCSVHSGLFQSTK